MIERAASALTVAEHVLLITHEEPDGDALGATLALVHALRSLGKQVTAACIDEAPRPFRFLPGIERFTRDYLIGSFDAVVILDCGDVRRTGYAHRVREFSRHRNRIINIDHHQRNDLHKLAAVNYVDFEASSTAELVYPLIAALGAELTPDIATCLLTGLYSDTGGFKHSNTSPTVLSQAAALMEAGASLRVIKTHITNRHRLPALRIWGLALSRAKYHEQLGIVIAVIAAEDFAACGAEPTDLDGCVNLLNCVPRAKAAILVSERSTGQIRASIRTEDDRVDVGAIAQLFGGGGIRKAAGFSLKGVLRTTTDGWMIDRSQDPVVVELPYQLLLPYPAPVALPQERAYSQVSN
ncbi:MAG: DHH family phosphoesterase [Patescibacteria group bacterium]|jgi:phosphoesterase RecJ-like protein